MLVDAIRAEGFRLSKNRGILFWSLIFPQILFLAGAILSFVIEKSGVVAASGNAEARAEMAAAMPKTGVLDMGQSLAASGNDLANPLILAFVLIGAAILFAGDYRWETWRLVTSRNSRVNLVLGKVVVFAGLALAAMLAFIITGLTTDVIQAAVFSRPLGFSMSVSDVGHFLAAAALSLVRITQFVMIGLLIATVTRSLLATLFVPLVLGIGQAFGPLVMGQARVDPDGWIGILALPARAVGALYNLVAGGLEASLVPDGMAIKAAISLALWTLLPLVGAIAWFNRQDLSKE